ncbi:flagellar hook-associated protein FlgK [Sulfuriferula sp. AH1]|uniref:flagellar hook-associated protein FlgK n=1 Tax=Sulfuriferula sp. AH1 TaxID=1985873 RepID=UPI000B3B3216|nr:flagellar hook-associated protein FlgK [Sulfuriferula sp. AH1]ARU31690.1 flagellar hook-associated protein FlgK [Sulfuriferula sp. AH1]
MATNILSIGQSALAAAQVGISTTGHNIANASTPGYSRQVVVQGAALAQNFGYGFVGQGVDVTTIQRIYSDFQAAQVRSTQSAKSGLDSYYAQITQVNNMFADSTSGLSPTLQGFFSGIQNLASDPSSGAARQTTLSSANALASTFQNMGSQLDQMNQSVNAQVTSSVATINSLATQIAQLNSNIALAQGSGQPPNDLLDQRDQLVLDLSKQIKTSVVPQDDGKYNIFIGNGQSLVVGSQAYSLTTAVSPTDSSRVVPAYNTPGKTVLLDGSALTGGQLGGLLDFRNQTLDPAKNALGRVAIGLATTFNAQHRLGQDQNGNLGGDFFTVGTPSVTANTGNLGSGVATASISDVNALTVSDYRLQYDGANYTVTRVSDGKATTFASFPQTIDGVSFNLTGTPAAGDNFLIKPTATGATVFGVNISDPSLIAAAAPIVTSATISNTGTGVISAGSVDSAYLASPLTAPVTLTYASGTNQLTGFPASQPVTVTSNGTTTTFAAGAPVTYTPGATISFGGISFTLSGTPANADTFTVGPNTGGVGDNRNALLLGALQTANTLANGTASYQGAFSQMVATIGSKTNEINVTSTAEGQTLSNLVAAQQSTSGVNLDEEATNLLRYQQAYQAAGKVMQVASQLFSVLLSLGQ